MTRSAVLTTGIPYVARVDFNQAGLASRTAPADGIRKCGYRSVDAPARKIVIASSMSAPACAVVIRRDAMSAEMP
jgi:hypothetical protein